MITQKRCKKGHCATEGEKQMNDQTTSLSQIKELIRIFRKKRGWTNEDPKDIALSLILEGSELLEHFQWLTGDEVLNNQKIKDAISEEMSDVLWWLVNLGDRLGIDVAQAFERKMEKNEKKYPESLFSPTMTQEEKDRAYYKIKAATRGGHPLYEPEQEKEKK
ncbi:MAG: nucleotide pyrophosphohydrolase [Candidatus Pacebacteria bacterium]|nr:nucleotide pyrophosphohydrolase [Candidatus Paceibacterota bacterium]